MYNATDAAMRLIHADSVEYVTVVIDETNAQSLEDATPNIALRVASDTTTPLQWSDVDSITRPEAHTIRASLLVGPGTDHPLQANTTYHVFARVSDLPEDIVVRAGMVRAVS